MHNHEQSTHDSSCESLTDEVRMLQSSREFKEGYRIDLNRVEHQVSVPPIKDDFIPPNPLSVGFGELGKPVPPIQGRS